MNTKLIISLDFDDLSHAKSLVDQLDPTQCALKIGSEMFTRFGVDWVRILKSIGFKIFLDLKFHDIPNTVFAACRAAADLGVWMMNVHASGGLPMMDAAREALLPYGSDRPLLIAVTVLTSISEQNHNAMKLQSSLAQRVMDLAGLAKEASLDGVVSAVDEVAQIKSAFGVDFLTITPGIRRASDAPDDQSRVATPEAAVRAGSDFLVVGRPITRAKNPQIVVEEILQSIK
ncbi:MAG: orotidine-5'-phosphate decarboxylase [Legionellales bacterium]|nr:orotidine-5'-phosphate decarboxylase [Legionellales bacterium]